MQQKNTQTAFFADIQENMRKMMETSPIAQPFDVQAVMDMQRKNMQAMTEAGRTAMQGWQKLAKHQADMVSHMMQAGMTMTSEPPSADAIKVASEKAMAMTRDMMDLARECGMETAKLIGKRATASAQEMKSAMMKQEMKEE